MADSQMTDDYRWEHENIDQEKTRVEREARHIISDLLENGDEDKFVEYLKGWKPEMKPEQLQEWIMLFRAYHAEKRGV